MKDVAERAGVSIATVSHVLSGKRRVTADIANKVRRAAKDLGYSVDRVASQMRTGRTKVVGIMVPDLEDLFLNRFVACLETHAGAAGFDVIVASSHNDYQTEHTRLSALLAWRPSGLIIVPCGDRIPPGLLEAGTNTPVIFADRVAPGKAPFDTVTVDNYSAGQKITDHLLNKGVSSIVFITATLDLYTIRERLRGAQELIASRNDVTTHVLEVGSDPHLAARKLSEWLEVHGPPGAIVALTNMMTLAALDALARQKLEAPESTLLAGFHDSLWMTARRVPITTMAQPVDDVASCVWERLEKRMFGDNSSLQNIILSTHLIERASTMPSEKRSVSLAGAGRAKARGR